MEKINKAQKFMRIFKGEEDHEIWMVGGAVRDMVLGIEPYDIDFVTPKTPEEIKEILMEGGVFKRNIDMKDHAVGTVVVTYDDEVYEITTFRQETYAPGNRRPVVTFTTDIYADALRRDFNINSIYWDGRHNLFDPMGGLYYSNNGNNVPGKLSGVITANIGPEESYRVDPLRVLRLYRFAKKYDLTTYGAYPSEGSEYSIINLSFQTIRKELEKGFKVTGMYREYLAILPIIIPYFYALRSVPTYNFPYSGDPIDCWAFLMRTHIGPDGMPPALHINLIRKSLKMMEFSKEDIEKIVIATGLENQYLKDTWVQRRR